MLLLQNSVSIRVAGKQGQDEVRATEEHDKEQGSEWTMWEDELLKQSWVCSLGRCHDSKWESLGGQGCGRGAHVSKCQHSSLWGSCRREKVHALEKTTPQPCVGSQLNLEVRNLKKSAPRAKRGWKTWISGQARYRLRSGAIWGFCLSSPSASYRYHRGIEHVMQIWPPCLPTHSCFFEPNDSILLLIVLKLNIEEAGHVTCYTHRSPDISKILYRVLRRGQRSTKYMTWLFKELKSIHSD